MPFDKVTLIQIELRAGGRCQALPAEISIMIELPVGQISVRELIIRELIGTKMKKQDFAFN